MTTSPATPHPARLSIRYAGTVRAFDKDRVVIGRDLGCDVVVADAAVSRHHLAVERDSGGFTLVDSSSGGTFVAGRRVGRLSVATEPVDVRLGGPQGETVSLWCSPLPTVVPPPPYAGPAAPGAAPAAPSARAVARSAATTAPPPYRASPPPYKPQSPATSQPRTPPQIPQPARVVPPPYEPQSNSPAPVSSLPPGRLAHGSSMMPAGATGRTLTIGRDLSNDIVLDDPLVSRFHGRLEPGQGTNPAVLHDLGSFNGLYVNGRRVAGSAWLPPGSEVIVGNQTFRWDGATLTTSATTHEFTLYADGLSTVVAGNKVLLDNVSFQLEPSSLTAVIGPSGAGKSTLLGALTGLRPATHGRVIWQGHDLYRSYEQLRFQIGLVPQQDIQHPQLKVRQALGYAAELRLPPDTTAPEREQRVATVAGQLQLTQRLDNRIGTELSGGQKKRVSIATELLTAPPLLFLDEPTSGLDPGLDLEVMKQLRGLADDGRVVVVVTHSVLALDVCDNVMVLAPGGRIAYFGPPAGVLAHFGCSNYPAVFDMLDDHDLWQRIPMPQRSTATAQVQAVAAPVPPAPRQTPGRQFWTLLRRTTAVVMADRLLLAMLLLLPLILGGLSRLVPGHHGLSLDAGAHRAQTAQGVRLVYDAGESVQRLVVLIVAAALMGTAITIRELVGERPIFQREYAVGLSPGVYHASKIAVLGVAGFFQGVLVTFIALVGLPGPDGAAGATRTAFAIGALAFVTAVLGLLLSALVTSTEQTMPVLVGVIMVELVLSGALFPVAGRPVLEQLAWLSPSRWGYVLVAGAMGINRTVAPGDHRDWLAGAGVGHTLLALLVLALLAGGIVFGGYLAVRRSATED